MVDKYSEKNEINPKLNALYGKYLENNDSGTIVFWDNIDRIDLGEIPNKKEIKFNTILNNVRSHLELVFHSLYLLL